MNWILIILVLGILGISFIIIYIKMNNSGTQFVERASFRNLPGCGRQLLRSIRQKLGGC